MVSIARSQLLFDWRRYLAAVLAITFAGLLIIIQLALLLGQFNTVSVSIDQSDSQLWIGFPKTQSVDLGRPVSVHSDALAWAHPGVARVERYITVYGDLRRGDGVPVSVTLNAIDTTENASAFSRLLTREQRALLQGPDAVLIDEADFNKLGAGNNTHIEINGKHARIAGMVKGLRTIGSVNVLTSFSTARHLAPETANTATFYLLQLKPGYSANAVKQELADKNPVARYAIWEAKAFSQQSQLYWLLESGSGIGSGFASLLALLVGMVITSQTLSAAIMASSKEFAALRALGVPQSAFRSVVMEQSTWLGLVGLAITALLTLGIAWIGVVFHIPMAFSLWMLAGTGSALMIIAIASGLLALRPLLHTDPASLLR